MNTGGYVLLVFKKLHIYPLWYFGLLKCKNPWEASTCKVLVYSKEEERWKPELFINLNHELNGGMSKPTSFPILTGCNFGWNRQGPVSCAIVFLPFDYRRSRNEFMYCQNILNCTLGNLVPLRFYKFWSIVNRLILKTLMKEK